MSRTGRTWRVALAVALVVTAAAAATPRSPSDLALHVAAGGPAEGGSGHLPLDAGVPETTDETSPATAPPPETSSTSTTPTSGPTLRTEATADTRPRSRSAPTTTSPTAKGLEDELTPPYVPAEPYPHVRGGGLEGKLPPGGSVYTYDPRRTVFEATTDGYHLRVRLDPPAPKVGDVVHFFTEIDTPPAADCCIVAGYGTVLQRDGEGRCPTGPIYDVVDVYNEPGRHEFQVQVFDCSTFSKTLVWLIGEVEVGPGAGTKQGPQLPTVEMPWFGANNQDVHQLRIPNIEVGDRDGWIAQLRVDWGDGSPVEIYPGDPTPCRSVPPDAWPEPVGFHTQHAAAGSMGWVPYDGPQHFDHTYTGAGTYTVTVTARSTACDGISMPQEGSATLKWEVPAAG